jgi:hypothetical protein
LLGQPSLAPSPPPLPQVYGGGVDLALDGFQMRCQLGENLLNALLRLRYLADDEAGLQTRPVWRHHRDLLLLGEINPGRRSGDCSSGILRFVLRESWETRPN